MPPRHNLSAPPMLPTRWAHDELRLLQRALIWVLTHDGGLARDTPLRVSIPTDWLARAEDPLPYRYGLVIEASPTGDTMHITAEKIGPSVTEVIRDNLRENPIDSPTVEAQRIVAALAAAGLLADGVTL